MEKAFSNKIRNIHYILMIFIVCLHASLYTFVPKISWEYQIFSFIETFCDLAVPTYFIISSYLFFRNFERNIYIYKLKRRIKTVLIPYLLWSMIMWLYYALFTNLSFIRKIMNSNHYVEISILSFLKGVFLGTEAETMWFLRVLFIDSIVSPLIYLIATRKWYVRDSIIILLLTLNICIETKYTSFIYWLPLYLIAAIISVNYKEKVEKYNSYTNKKVLFSIINFLIILLITQYFKDIRGIYYIYRILSGFFFIYFFGSIKLFEKYYNFKLDPFFVFAVHVPIVQIIRKILMMKISNCFIVHIATIICTMLLIYIGTIILKRKPFKKLYSILIR